MAGVRAWALRCLAGHHTAVGLVIEIIGYNVTMHLELENVSAVCRPEPGAMEPLPWEWFDFVAPSRAVEGPFPTVDQQGWRRVWQVEVDGRAVPFKFFRRTAENGKTRPVLLLVHGMGLTIATFRGISGHLFATHDLLLPDYSSFMVRRWAEPDTGGAKLYAQSMWRIADAGGVGRVSLAGNSLGGGLCLVMAVMQPSRVQKMLLSNPACYPQELPRMYRMMRVPLLGEFLMCTTSAEKFVDGVEYVSYVDKSRFDPVLRRRYVQMLKRPENRFRLMDIMRRLPADARDSQAALHMSRLGEITCPVLLTWGEQDPLLAKGSGQRLAAALPNVTFERYPELSHMPHEEAPEMIGRRWADWLNE